MRRASWIAAAAVATSSLACTFTWDEPTEPEPAPVVAPEPAPEVVPDGKAGKRGAPKAGASCGGRARPTCVEDTLATCTDGVWVFTPCDPYGCIPVGTPGFEGMTEDGCGAD